MVGLGAMGRPIAGFIAAAGFDVVAYDVSPDASAPDGVRLVESVKAVAQADAVIVIVPTDEDVIAVVSELLDHGRSGLVVVVSASVRPQTCRDLAAQAATRGMHVIDAALTGGVRGAETATINLLVGGAQEVADRVAPVFRAFATNYHVLGDVGAGQVGKSANNLIHWAQIVAIDESLRLAEALGVSPARLREALQEGPTDSRTLREIEFMRFTWYRKDIEIAQSLATDVDRSLPVADLSLRLMPQITPASVAALLEP
jgi:3-hydroxyisobutyrate dehydrogenase-like beta-hydroxyacid dehydrogenase